MRIKINPDKKKAERIQKLISKSDGYCPCVILKCENTKCPCKDFREMRTEGWCHCGLYYKELENEEADT